MEFSVLDSVGTLEAARLDVVSGRERVIEIGTLGEGSAKAGGGVVVVLGASAAEEEGAVHLVKSLLVEAQWKGKLVEDTTLDMGLYP